MAYAPNLGIGSRQWRDFFASTQGWTNISLAPSRTRRVFDVVSRPTTPTVLLLAPGEYTGPFHVSSPYPLLIRPSQLGESSKVVIKCPEPDRTSRRIKYVGSGGGSDSNNQQDELAMEPALVLSHGAQVFVEGIHVHGRVEITDGASAEFLDCVFRLAPHVALASSQIYGGKDSGNKKDESGGDDNINDSSGSSKRRHRTYYQKYSDSKTLHSSSGGGNVGDVVQGNAGTSDALCQQQSAITVLAGNLWASNCVIDVLSPRGIGLLATSASSLPGSSSSSGNANYMDDSSSSSQQYESTTSSINIQACVLRRSTYGFVFYGNNTLAPRIENNRITNCSVAGLVFGGSSRGSVRSNHVGQCEKFGVVLEGHSAPWLHQNIVEENGICGVLLRDSAAPTLVRNTLLANGTCQLFTADVASVRCQANHFSGESVNGSLPSQAAVSSYSARNILAGSKGDVYGCCFTDNSNGVLENCVIECADSCVISSTGATVKCLNCTLQPEGNDKYSNSNQSGGGDNEMDGGENNSSSSNSQEKQQQQQERTRRQDATGIAFALQKAFVKSSFADLTTDGSVITGGGHESANTSEAQNEFSSEEPKNNKKQQTKYKIEVRALEDFPDVQAVIADIPNYFFPSTSVVEGRGAGDRDSMTDEYNQTISSRPTSRQQQQSSGGPICTDAAIRMSLSFTPRRPFSGQSSSSHHRPMTAGSSGSSSSRHVLAQSSSSTDHPPHSPTSTSYYHSTSGVGSETGGDKNASTTRLQRLQNMTSEHRNNWHELKDKKQIYSLKNEVSRLRRQLYKSSQDYHHHQEQVAQKKALERQHQYNIQQAQHQQRKQQSSSGGDGQHHPVPPPSPSRARIISGGDTEEGSYHVLGYHRWNNSKMKDFYHGKATLAEVRSEEKMIPGTDASLGERLHDRWLRHKHDIDREHDQEDEKHRDEVKSRSLTLEQQKELGRRLHDDVMERFREDHARLEREEKNRHRIHAPFMEANAARRRKSILGGGGDGEDVSASYHGGGGGNDNNADNSAKEEEEMRCQRISDRLREQAEAREESQRKLRERYLKEYNASAPESLKKQHEKKLSRKQIEAYCASLYKSHRDEEYAAAAYDTVSFEFASKAKARDDARRDEYLNGTRSPSPQRSREQIEAYSDSLYRGHKDIGAKNKALDLLEQE